MPDLYVGDPNLMSKWTKMAKATQATFGTISAMFGEKK